MKQTFIFPYDHHLFSFFKHVDAVALDDTKVIPMAFRGSGLVNKDIADAVSDLHTGIDVYSSYDFNSIEKNHVVHFAQNYYLNEEALKACEELRKQCVKNHYEYVIHTNYLKDDWDRNNDKDEYNASFSRSVFDVNLHDIESQYVDIYRNLKTPILYVSGIIDSADIPDLALTIRESLEGEGISVCTLLKNSIAPLWGAYHYLPILLSRKYVESQKIAKLNSYMANIEMNDSPDLILIEAPDPILRFNDYATNGFGILSYMLGQAAPPSAMILSVPYLYLQNDFIKIIQEAIERIYQAPIISFSVTNAIPDNIKILQNHEMSFFYSRTSIIREKIEVAKKANTGVNLIDPYHTSKSKELSILINKIKEVLNENAARRYE